MRSAFWNLRLGALALVCCLFPPATFAASSLSWNVGTGRVDAEIKGWKLPDLLQQVAQATGWQVFLEPETERVVFAKFKDQPTGEALRLLLGDVNYALLPQTSGPKRLFVFKTTLSQATQRIETQIDTSIPIPNELIVRVKPGTDIEALARSLGAEIVGKTEQFNTYRLRFKDKESADRARELMQENEDVTGFAPNYHVDRVPRQETRTFQPPPGNGLPTIKANPNSEQVIVGLIDTAVQKTGTELDQWLLPTISVAGPGEETGGDPTHGTAMYQTMLRSIAEASGENGANVRILPVDVYGGNPLTSTFDVANGIVEAINHGATVINLSLGSEGDSGYLHAIIQEAYRQGITFTGAPGNVHVDTPNYPAFYPEVLSVTASDPNGNIAEYANTGDWVDAIAPGTTRFYYDGRIWQTSGTSVSTAWLTGWISVQPSPREAVATARTQFAR